MLPLLNGLEHVEAIRERLSLSATESSGRPSVAAGSIGRLEAFSPEPGVVVQRSAGNAVVNAASRELDGTALDAALEPLRVPGIDVVLGHGRACRPLGEGGPARGAGGGDGGERRRSWTAPCR